MSSSPISKHGVLTISGFGLKVLVRSYHLHIEDGIADERRQFSLPRICNLRRLVCIGSDGFVTLDALKFLSSIGAAFIHLDRMGKVLFVTGPSTTADGRLHRAQSLAMSNGTALTISKELIKAKIQGQYNFVHTQLNDSITTNVIAGF